MTPALRAVLFTAAVLAAAASLPACLWDYDTLKMERQFFPDALELITGKFLRHSPDFYRWRVENRQRRIESSPSDVALYDDLAVAYDKLGDQEKAIETMRRKDEISPGLYETYANLATFQVHSGDLPRSVELVERALEINPDAHFGREIYQKHLVSYLLSKQHEGRTVFPLAAAGEPNFADYLYEQQRQAAVARGEDAGSGKTPEIIAPAVKGVLGMMRFARHDSPLLLEALGDLLHTHLGGEALQLASRAYLKASYETTGEASAAYREKAQHALAMQKGVSLESLERELKAELDDARTRYETVEADEARWIAAGLDADEEFSRKYYVEPAVGGGTSGTNSVNISYHPGRQRGTLQKAALTVAILCLAGALAWRWKTRRPAAAIPPGTSPE